MSSRKSVKSHRLGVPVPPARREPAPGPSPCRVTQGYFPDPAAALGLGWTAAQIMADCRRMARDELTPVLHKRLLAAGLSPAQVDDLYRLSRKQINYMRDLAAKRAEEREEEDDSMKFHEALTNGMAAGMALETSDASRPRDITRENLQTCVDGGLTREEMAKGFGTTVSGLNTVASRIGFKFPAQPRKSLSSADDIAAENKAAALHTPTAEELADFFNDDRPPAASDDETVQLLLDAFHDSDGPVKLPAAANASGEDEWTFAYGAGRKEGIPLLTVYVDGRIMIKRMTLPTNTLYLFRFNRDLTKCRIERSPDGAKVHLKNTEGIESRSRPLAAKIKALGLQFPVKYRLDPATMEGERMG